MLRKEYSGYVSGLCIMAMIYLLAFQFRSIDNFILIGSSVLCAFALNWFIFDVTTGMHKMYDHFFSGFFFMLFLVTLFYSNLEEGQQLLFSSAFFILGFIGFNGILTLFTSTNDKMFRLGIFEGSQSSLEVVFRFFSGMMAIITLLYFIYNMDMPQSFIPVLLSILSILFYVFSISIDDLPILHLMGRHKKKAIMQILATASLILFIGIFVDTMMKYDSDTIQFFIIASFQFYVIIIGIFLFRVDFETMFPIKRWLASHLNLSTLTSISLPKIKLPAKSKTNQYPKEKEKTKEEHKSMKEYIHAKEAIPPKEKKDRSLSGIAILGSSGSGKTVFFAMLSYVLGGAKHSNLKIEYVDGLDYLRDLRKPLERGEWPAKTFTRRADTFSARIHDKKALGTTVHNLRMNDISGEDFTKYIGPDHKGALPEHMRYIDHASGYILIVSPDTLEDDMWTFISMVKYLVETRKLKNTQKFKEPVAVVISKHDQNRNILDAESYIQDHAPDLHMSLKLRAKPGKLKFFFCSAVGDLTAEGKPRLPLAPMGVAEVIEWTLKNNV